MTYDNKAVLPNKVNDSKSGHNEHLQIYPYN